jgi:Mor family transcriptional regulator
MIKHLNKDDLQDSFYDIADEIGLDTFVKLCELCGGSSLYIPTMKSLLKPVRNRVIKESFDGGNYKELARKYNITEVQVRKIISNM